jgi:hypothetical protein
MTPIIDVKGLKIHIVRKRFYCRATLLGMPYLKLNNNNFCFIILNDFIYDIAFQKCLNAFRYQKDLAVKYSFCKHGCNPAHPGRKLPLPFFILFFFTEKPHKRMSNTVLLPISYACL